MCDSAVPYLRYQAITLKNMNGVVYCMLVDHEWGELKNQRQRIILDQN